MPHQHPEPGIDACSQRRHRTVTGRYKTLSQQQVLRRVSADNQFGNDEQLGPRVVRPAGCGVDQLAVAGDISDRRIKLCDGKFHILFIRPGAMPSAPVSSRQTFRQCIAGFFESEIRIRDFPDKLRALLADLFVCFYFDSAQITSLRELSRELFNRDSKRSACRAADTRSSADIPAKIGVRRFSGMSCESRLNNAAFGRNQGVGLGESLRAHRKCRRD